MTCMCSCEIVFKTKNGSEAGRMNHSTCEKSSSEMTEDNPGKAINKIEIF